jgi:fumarate reductase flavoprotein subunit
MLKCCQYITKYICRRGSQMKKRILCILLVGIMIFSLLGFTEGAITGTYTKTEKGFGGDVTVTVTLENGVIKAVKAEGPKETPTVGGKAIASCRL